MSKKKIKLLEAEVKKEISSEKEEYIKSYLKERLIELDQAKRVIARLEKQYNDLLEKDIDELLLSIKPSNLLR